MEMGNRQAKEQSRDSRQAEKGSNVGISGTSRKYVPQEIEYTGNLMSKKEAAASLPDETMYRSLEFALMKSQRYDVDSGVLAHSKGVFEGRISELLKQKKPILYYENIQFEKAIGKGSYGTVWKAKWAGQKDIAVKIIEDMELPYLYLERDILVKLKHNRIVQLLGAFHASVTYFVMPLYKGDLTSFKKLSDVNIFRYIIQLLEAVAWIHEKNVIHCDIKPNNCLITQNNNLVLTDFGSALFMDPLLYKGKYVQRKTLFGVPAYSDYEVNTNLNYSTSNDVFAVGCVAFELRTGLGFLWSKYNWSEKGDRFEVQQIFKNGRKMDEGTKFLAPLEKFKNGRVALKDTLQSCVPYEKFLAKILLPETSNRPTALEVLRDESMLNLMEHYNVGFGNLDTSGLDDDLKSPLRISVRKPEIATDYYREDTLSLGLFYLDAELVTEYQARIEMVDKSTQTTAVELTTGFNSPMRPNRTPEIAMVKDMVSNIPSQHSCSDDLKIAGIKSQLTTKAAVSSKKDNVTERLIMYLKSMPLWKKLEQELENDNFNAHMKTESQIVFNLEKTMQVKKDNEPHANASSETTVGIEPLRKRPSSVGTKSEKELLLVRSKVSNKSCNDSEGDKTQLFQIENKIKISSKRPAKSNPSLQPFKRAKEQADIKVPNASIKNTSNEVDANRDVMPAELNAAPRLVESDNDNLIEIYEKAELEVNRETDCPFCEAKFGTWSELYAHVIRECDLSTLF